MQHLRLHTLSYRHVTVASVVIASAVIVLLAIISPGPAMWWTFIPAMVIACTLHLFSTARVAPDSRRVLPIYLIAMLWQFLHFADEYTGSFWIRRPVDVFGAPPMSVEFFVWGSHTGSSDRSSS